jgi:putative hemolysin
MNFEQVFEPIANGPLVVRLAETEAEIVAAQRLRYHIFCDELGGEANEEVRAQKRDFDEYDQDCHHVLVIDNSLDREHRVVGTYRLMTRETIAGIGRFYTENEYDLGPVKQFDGPVLELGRSCVDIAHRTRPVIQMLWQGIGAFIAARDIGLMFGCASLYGADVERHKLPLSYLYHYHLAPAEVRPRALPEQYVKMDWLPKDQISPRAALKLMPPLIKGYLRLNSYVGDGAVLDHAYNTCDVSIVVQTDQVKAKYSQRYIPDGE